MYPYDIVKFDGTENDMCEATDEEELIQIEKGYDLQKSSNYHSLSNW